MADPYQDACSRVQDDLLAAINAPAPAEEAILTAVVTAFPAAFTIQRADDGGTGIGQLVRTAAATDVDRQLLDDALRLLLIDSITYALDKQQPVMRFVHAQSKSGQPLMPKLLDMVLHLCEHVVQQPGGAAPAKMFDSTLHTRCLEELMELGTITDCHDVFSYMEAHTGRFQRKEYFEPGWRTILRTCNQLLKRLSKAHDVQLCGRLLVFLAKMYPLSDKSGLNPHFSVNTALGTLPLDDVATGATDSIGEPIDARLYTTFWGLQQLFMAPSTVLQPASWARVLADVNVVLDEFAKITPNVHATGPQPAAAGSAGPAGRQQHDADSSGVRYLSSSKLFGLQLRDATFRRHFLVQLLTLTHYLKHPNQKDKPPAQPLEGVDELNGKVLDAMAKTKVAGTEFASSIQAALERETMWLVWKNAGCKEIERPAAPSLEELQQQLLAQQQQAAAEQQPGRLGGPKRRRPNPKLQGSGLSLAQLLAVPSDNMAGLKSSERKLVPSLQEFLTPVIEDMDPEASIEVEYRRRQDKIYAWKAMRLLSRTNLELSSNANGDLERAVCELYPEIKIKYGIPDPPAPEKPGAGSRAGAGARPQAAGGTVTPTNNGTPQQAAAAGGDDGGAVKAEPDA